MDQNQPAPMGQYQPVTDTNHVMATEDPTTALMTSYPSTALMAAPPTGIGVLSVLMVSAAMDQLLHSPKDTGDFLSALTETFLCAIRISVRDIFVIKIIDYRYRI